MQQLSEISVPNIFLYVADAVRWDALPDRLSTNGLTVKTLASSIHTACSFPSITTGLHPPQHGIWDFSYRLNEDIPSLLHLDGYSSSYANTLDELPGNNPQSQSILDKILRTTEESFETIETIEPPFVFLERGPGGHAPYGNYPGNGQEYFQNRGASKAELYQREYNDSIESDVSHFESQVKILSERDLLEDTLIIYTSDHGELLGERGSLGHNDPIHPKHVYVPTVMMHPSIENEDLDGLLRHIDLFPTILSILGGNVRGLPGNDLKREELADHGASYYRRSVAPNLPIISGHLDYESVWDSNGGYVVPKNGRMNRVAILCGKLFKSPKREYMRHHLSSVISFYLSGEQKYGDPNMSRNKAIEILEEISNLPQSLPEQSALDDSAKDRLRELGYLET